MIKLVISCLTPSTPSEHIWESNLGVTPPDGQLYLYILGERKGVIIVCIRRVPTDAIDFTPRYVVIQSMQFLAKKEIKKKGGEYNI